MDPVTLALIASGLGAGLVTALTKLLEKGVIDPSLETGLKPLREFLTRGYNRKADEAKLVKALQAALKSVSGSEDPNQWAQLKWAMALGDLQNDPGLAARFAAAAIEMTGDDPARLPPDLLRDLKLDQSHKAKVASLLFNFRKELANVAGYDNGIAYADKLNALNLLDGLHELVAGLAATVTDADGVKALRVQIMAPDARRLETPYLDNVVNEFTGLPLEGRSADDTLRADDQLRLARVYIALNTKESRVTLKPEKEQKKKEVLEREDFDRHPLSALRAVMESRRLVLLGDPGSGKSTFAQHLCLCLAGARLDPASEWPKQLQASDLEGWGLAHYALPLFIRLRSFASDIECLPADSKQMGRAEHLWAYVEKELRKLGRPALVEHALTLLEAGEAFVVFDGLDEVADPKRRTQVAEAVAHFAYKRFPHARMLVTCRVKQYPLDAKNKPTADWRLPGFPVAELADFDPNQIETFVVQWFDELRARGRPIGHDQTTLLPALAARPELGRELAPKPILLTQMAIVHATKKLPDSRIKVYEDCAGLLLWEWERLKARQGGRQGDSAEAFLETLGVPGLRLSEVEDALDQAVFQAHAAGEADISGERLRRALQKTFMDLYDLPSPRAIACAEQFIVEWLRGRNGLLLPAGEDTFDLPHRTFREFMAACYLRQNSLANPDTGDDEDWKLSGPRLVKADYDKWREVLRFAAGLASLPEVANALHELCPDQASLDPVEIQRLLLTGEIARDVGARNLSARSNKLGKQVYERLEDQLIHLMRDTDDSRPYPDDPPRLTPPTILSPRNRARNRARLAAGDLLNDLGWTPPDLYDFMPVYNTDTAHKVRWNLTDPDPLNSTHPSFFLAKHLTTNHQYARFLAADDYADPEIWKAVQAFDAEGKPQDLGDKAWDWFQRNGGKDRRPYFWDDARFGSTRRLFPVVGVTWHEAAAYCVWLTRHWRDLPEAQSLITNNQSPTSNPSTMLRAGFQFRLPTEAEWLAAAGGVWPDQKTEEETPRYVWQTTPARVDDAELVIHANTRESNLEGTTPVCMYPAGMSPAHVMDMSGNVWEWQANLYRKGVEYRALRGGAWAYDAGNARVAARDNLHPDNGWGNYGFRVWGAAPVSRS
jgi:formylglycine-generating enzyme required for sulfatase activity